MTNTTAAGEPSEREAFRVHRPACADCSLPYTDHGWADFVVADETWAKLIGSDPAPLLCACCMVRRAYRLGISAPGRFTSGPFCDDSLDGPIPASWQARAALNAINPSPSGMINRDRFETWCVSVHGYLAPPKWNDEENDYVGAEARMMWDVWNAAIIAYAPSPSEAHRKVFEAWCKSTALPTTTSDHSIYKDRDTYWAWEGWQALAALNVSAPSPSNWHREAAEEIAKDVWHNLYGRTFAADVKSFAAIIANAQPGDSAGFVLTEADAERAAEALFMHDRPTMFAPEAATMPWADLTGYGKDTYREKARAALRAIGAKS